MATSSLNQTSSPVLAQNVIPTEETRQRKQLVRKKSRDYSQNLRMMVQGAFLLLNIFIGLQFVLFVRYFETGGQSAHVSRPPGVEGWLPIAGLMNLKYLLVTGIVPSIHPAAMYLLLSFLLMSLVFHKAFCSWLCPVGTLSEALWKFGHRLFKKNWSLPRFVDLPLRSLKYLLLAFFLYAIGGMTAAAIEAFTMSPYGLVADIKMLHFFLNLSTTAAVTLAILLVLSVFLQNFWCRYLCPYGALMGLVAIFSPAKITRNKDRCIDCGKCTKACPSLLKVDQLVTVSSAECTSCMECVAVCPAEGALQISVLRRRPVSAAAITAGLAVLFFGIIGYAVLTGSWDSHIPDVMYERLIPQLDRLSHP